MTILKERTRRMDYEKKYKEALATARKLYNMRGDWTNLEIESIFPELCESEDERIRKELIQNLKERFGTKGTMGGNLDMPKVLAWLEKQGDKEKFIKKELGCIKGYRENAIKRLEELEKQSEQILDNSAKTCKDVEQKPADKIQLGKKYRCIASPRYSTFMKGEIYKPEDKFLCSLMNFCSDCFEPIEGEQNHTDKVEPKFRNGQWIVWKDKCYKVNYNGCGYELVDQDGLSTSLEYGTIDENAHLWDITKDANDGDVLHCWIDGDEFVLIYKGIKDGYITTYGHLYQKLKSFSEEPTTMFCRTIQGHFTPATKEQRDLLFQKMKEAGYEWDAEKKELRKINSYCEKHCKGYQETGKCFADSDCKAKREAEQNLAWGKDDEYYYGIIQYILNNECVGKTDKEEAIKWFKSLKDRVTPQSKQEWSEEDEKEVAVLEAYIRSNDWSARHVDRALGIVDELVNKVKALRPNKQWKPSDEQLDALEKVVSERQSIALESLYEDIRKLKE